VVRYDAKNKPVAQFKFYDEFFSMTGAGSMSEYSYEQVTSVRMWQNYLYLFFGTDQGVFVDKESFTEEELVRLVTHIKSKKS